MPARNKSLWQFLYPENAAAITPDLIDEELSNVPQDVRRGVAWMHNAFLALIMDKFGSTDAFLTHLLNKAGLNKNGFLFVSEQMEQCAKIAKELQPDCDAATKSAPRAELLSRLFDQMHGWWSANNTASVHSRSLLRFLSLAAYVTLNCPKDLTKKVLHDRSLDETIRFTYLAAAGLHLVLSNDQLGKLMQLFAQSVGPDSEPPALTDGVWNVFSVDLKLDEIGFFVKFCYLLIGMLYDWKEEDSWPRREVPNCNALPQLTDAVRVVDKFIPNGAALKELAPCIEAADKEMHRLDIEDRKKALPVIKSLAAAHARALQSLDEEDCQTLRAALIDLGVCSRALCRNKTKAELFKRGLSVCEDNDKQLILPAFDWIRELEILLRAQ